MRGLVDPHIDFVARVLRNSGTPHAEIDDEVQRTFIVAARRLDDIRPGAEKSFLFRIAFNLAAHAPSDGGAPARGLRRSGPRTS